MIGSVARMTIRPKRMKTTAVTCDLSTTNISAQLQYAQDRSNDYYRYDEIMMIGLPMDLNSLVPGYQQFLVSHTKANSGHSRVTWTTTLLRTPLTTRIYFFSLFYCFNSPIVPKNSFSQPSFSSQLSSNSPVLINGTGVGKTHPPCELILVVWREPCCLSR